MDQVELAKKIATKAHEGQFRWDGKTPYISHPGAVAKAIFSAHWHKYGDEALLAPAIAAAWLHDVIEDTAITASDLKEMGVEEQIVWAVECLSKKDKETYLDYLLGVKLNPIARMVKIEDIKHNMSDLDKKRKKSMYEKYELALFILQR